MTDKSAKSDEEGSKKTLVRILIAVGIGIPVLVELLTLFNLINVQLFEDEKAIRQEAPPTEIREYMIGDTLFADSVTPITIQDMLVKVSPQSWRFELALARSGSTTTAGPLLTVDSLKLKSGEIVSDAQSWEMGKSSGSDTTRFNWMLPSGEIPTVLYISAQRSVQKDSVSNQQQVQLGNIPVRYAQDDDKR
jgi:hypothetical protein